MPSKLMGLVVPLLVASIAHARSSFSPARPAGPRGWRALRGGAGEYSFSLTTFSPEGRLEQLEHALACVDGAPPVVALGGADCVVIVFVDPDLGKCKT